MVPDHSLLHRGDLLVYPRGVLNSQRIIVPPTMIEEIQDIRIDDPIPLATVPFYYGNGVSLDHRNWPRMRVSVYRVTADFVPQTNYPADYVAEWAVNRHRPLPLASISAVVRAMRVLDPQTAAAVSKAIMDSGPAAVNEALSDPDPASREIAHRWLRSSINADSRGHS